MIQGTEENKIPRPITREEMYLAAIHDTLSGSGVGSVGSVGSVGGETPFVVNFTSNDTGATFSSDKKYSEIIAALDAGRRVYGRVEASGIVYDNIPLVENTKAEGYIVSSDMVKVSFAMFVPYQKTLTILTFSIDKNDSLNTGQFGISR